MTTRFEDRLLAQLQDVVAARPAPEAPPAPAPPRPRRRLRVAIAAGAVGAVAGGAALLSGGGGVAYAVDSRADGTVTVTINDLRDAKGLEAELERAGVPAGVEYSASPPKECSSAGTASGERGVTRADEAAPGEGPTLRTDGPVSAAGEPAKGAPVSIAMRKEKDGKVTFELDPKSIPAGHKLAVTASDGRMTSLGTTVVPTDEAERTQPC